MCAAQHKAGGEKSARCDDRPQLPKDNDNATHRGTYTVDNLPLPPPQA